MRPYAEMAIEAKVERPSKGNNPESFVTPWARQLSGKDRTAGCDACQRVEKVHIASKYLQGILQMLVDLHDGGLVTAPVAVIGCCDTSVIGMATLGLNTTYLRIWLQHSYLATSCNLP